MDQEINCKNIEILPVYTNYIFGENLQLNNIKISQTTNYNGLL